MKSGAIILGIIVSTILLAAAGALYVIAGNNSEQHYRTSINLVRQVQQLSSNWSIEIARVKADPFADFDSLAAFIPRMARLKDNLSDTARRIPDLPDRLASDVNAYLHAVDAKEERIERFKTGYAVVRNSNRYLPLATANVTQQAREAKDEGLMRAISSLTRDMGAYLATPTDTAKDRLTGELQRLREASVAYPLPLANGLANLFSHAEVLLDKQVPTEKLFMEATSNDISDLTDRLAGNLEFELGKREVRTTYYEGGIMGVFGLLTLFWIVLALQQRTRAEVAGVQAAPVAGVQAAPAAAAMPIPLPQVQEGQIPIPQVQEGQIPLPQAPEVRAEAAAPPPADGPLAVAAAAPAPGGVTAAEDELLRAATSFAPDGPAAERDAESAVMRGFLAECVADSLASSTGRIANGMDRLRLAQNRIRGALQDSDALLELYDGADLDEEMEAASAVALNVRREANAVADVAKRLASFSSLPNGTANHDLVDLNACVDEAIEATGATGSATVAKKLGNVPEIFASKTDIRLLLAKIIENSVHAVEGLDDRRGTIKIDTARKNDEILITIIDNGVGITPDKRAKIFKPFYTSRDGAMGLGLTLAGHLAKKYEGVIKINSLPGQGTVTRITLPAGLPGS